MTETGNDTVEGTSFAVMVPGEGNPPSPTYADLMRVGAVDATDEPQLPVDPARPTSATFTSDGTPSPFAAGGLSYTTNALQMVGPNGYLRVGNPVPYERWLTTDPTSTAGPKPPSGTPKKDPATGNPEWPLGTSGILLHSNAEIDLFAPSINETTNTRLNVTWVAPKRVGILSGQTQEGGSMTNATYQVVDNLTTSIGNLLSTVTGASATVWTGSDASTGAGSLLWSNYGFTQNMFGGTVVNMTNTDVEVQGIGSTKWQDSTTIAPTQIFLGVAPTADKAKLVARFADMTRNVNVRFGVVVSAASAAVSTATGAMADIAGESNKDLLKTTLTAFKAEMWVLTGLVAVLQIAGTVVGIKLARSTQIPGPNDATASITIADNSIVLSAGSTKVTIGTAGFEVDAGDPQAYVSNLQAFSKVSISQPLAIALGQTVMGNVTDPQTQGTANPGNVPQPVKSISFKTQGAFSATGSAISFTAPV